MKDSNVEIKKIEGENKDFRIKLKPKERAFVELVLQNIPQVKAYTQAGFPAKTYSSAASGSTVLMKKPKVKAYIARRREELQKQLEAQTLVTQAQVLQEICKLAFSNMQDYVKTDKDGNFVFENWQNLSREQLAAVESVQVITTTTTNKKEDREYVTKNVKFKLHNKTSNLELIAKHLGMLADNGEAGGQVINTQIVLFNDCFKDEKKAEIIDDTK